MTLLRARGSKTVHFYPSPIGHPWKETEIRNQICWMKIVSMKCFLTLTLIRSLFLHMREESSTEKLGDYLGSHHKLCSSPSVSHFARYGFKRLCSHQIFCWIPDRPCNFLPRRLCIKTRLRYLAWTFFTLEFRLGAGDRCLQREAHEHVAALSWRQAAKQEWNSYKNEDISMCWKTLQHVQNSNQPISPRFLAN